MRSCPSPARTLRWPTRSMCCTSRRAGGPCPGHQELGLDPKLLAEAADEVMLEPSQDLALADAIDMLQQQARWAWCLGGYPGVLHARLGHKHLVQGSKPVHQVASGR